MSSAKPPRPIPRKVLHRDDFGLCVCWPKTEWARVAEPGKTCTVKLDDETRRVTVQTEACDCQGTGWHEHRFLSLPKSVGFVAGQRVVVEA